MSPFRCLPIWFLIFTAVLSVGVTAQDLAGTKLKVLPGTEALKEAKPLDEVMVAGIDRFALKAIASAALNRESAWGRYEPDAAAREETLGPLRDDFARRIGVVDQRLPAKGIELIATTEGGSVVAENEQVVVHAVRWAVLSGVFAEGLLLRPKHGEIVARVVALPDADWTPEMIAGVAGDTKSGSSAQQTPASSGEQNDLTQALKAGACRSRYALNLAQMGCEVLVPTLINRGTEFSGNPEINRRANLSHREFVYRQAFEMGRHVIGYEVQKVLAAIDQFERRNQKHDVPLVVVGVSEGGLLALYSAAIDPRIDAAIVSGYFNRRDDVWKEPIYRNVWGLLQAAGDAELALLVAPRQLYVEVDPVIPEFEKPAGRNGGPAAPGMIRSPDAKSVLAEVARVRRALPSQIAKKSIRVFHPDRNDRRPLASDVLRNCISEICDKKIDVAATPLVLREQRTEFSPVERQRVQVQQLVDFTQKVLRSSYRKRDDRFKKLDRSSVAGFEKAAAVERDKVYEELFGKLPLPTIDPNPRSRFLFENESMVAYDVVLDVYEDVIASGILLLPRDLKPGEKRPVVVCQHGLEGTPMDTISGPESKGFRAYKSFAAELAGRGFIVYAPQNPYRGFDAFRTLQRKSNVLGRSLFSYIIPQHLVTLRWLSTLENVDRNRIGFYGLSYGGKTAVRVPPMLPPTETEPGYCLSICSADFNEWVAKNASVDAPFSYLWTGEYEIFEWNMGNVANYAELSMLMTPRPFMVERGHDDGVGIDEWVAWEYAKVRRHYNKLGLGDQTEIEFFDGPHTIWGKGTYDFLHRHLNWPTAN